MGRPRKTHLHLPKYVKPNNGSLWYAPPNQKPVRICKIGEDAEMYKFMLAHSEPTGPIVTMRDVIDRYEREVVPTLGERTQKDYHGHLKILRSVFGDMRPNDITPKHIGQFLDVEKGKISRNRIAAVLSGIFTKAVGRWYVADRNPCIGVERNKSKPRDRYITNAEFEAIYAIMPPRHKIAMDLALLTGQRQGDLLKLEWDHVLEEGILFRQGKTKKGRLITYTPELTEVLNRARKLVPQIPRRYVIRTQEGNRYTSEGFRSIWQRYMRKAARKGVISERFTFHDIRSKSVSDESDINVASLRAGHSTLSMTKRVYDRGIRTVASLSKKQS